LARRILLADDSVTAQNMGRRILSDAGYEVITVNNGSAALKKVSEQTPDVIVLDVYMPGYGGLEVCQRLKEMSETARIPILLTVGKLEPFKPEEARRVRADAFIVKPFEAMELLAALTRLEDRIVPSANGSKGKKNSSEAGHGDEDTGWKNRLIIPPGGKGRTPDVAEADDFGQTEDSAKKSARKDEKTVAVAKTEENVKAAEEKVVSIETKASEAKSAKAESLESAPAEVKATGPAKEVAKAEADAKAESKVESKVEESRLAAPSAITEVVAAKADASAPSTATPKETYSGPRWIAEEVTASGDEKALALEREMEKSIAAAAAFDAGQKIAAEIEEEKKAAEKAAAVEAVAKEAPAAESVPAVVAEAKVEEVKVVEANAQETKAEESKLEAAKVEPAEAIEAAKTEETKSEVKPQEPAAPIEMPVVAPSIEAVAEETQPQAVASTESVAPKGEAFAAAASAGSSVVESALAPAPPAEDNANKQQLAAAWEQWQNVRESVLNSPVAEKITEVATATLKNAAEAAASAGNTTADIEFSQTTHASNPTNIANIVDSVLAELKPKLVEEIAKKLGNNKK
jgi:twitching motility two-component system response regulator PilH